MINKTRARAAVVVYLEGALQLAQDFDDGQLEELLERALDRARSAHLKAVERSEATVH
jgi:hypothetical protein